MLYYKKYLKYKYKYIQLKNNNQIGGGPPLNNIIKNIGLFEKNSDMDNFLNPIYGFIYVNTDFIKNHKIFYINGDKGISSFINTYFNNLIDYVQPIKLLMNKDFIKPKDIGIILGFLYCYKESIIQLNCHLEYTKLEKKKYNNLKDKQSDALKKFELSGAQEKLLTKKIKQIKDMIPNKYNLDKFKLIKALIDIIQNNINDKCFFRSVLAILWHISNDKKDIKEYYEGINESFYYYNDKFNLNLPLINIPDSFIDDLFDEELDKDLDMDFEKALFISNNLPLYNQEYSFYQGEKFPDCGEAVIRSFINIISYNKLTKSFDLEFLRSKGAVENLIEYYRVFNNFSKQSSNHTQLIFNTQMNARDAWNIVVSELPDVIYRNKVYNIGGYVDETNFLNVIRALFTIRINNLDDLVNQLQEKDDKNSSIIEISEKKNPTTININYNGNYKITINSDHYTIEKITTINTFFDYSKLDQEEKKIIDILLNIDNIYEKINENFYFIKWEKEKLINTFNRYYNDSSIDNKFYRKIFDYLYKNYKDLYDERNRIYLNIFKILPESFSGIVVKYPEISNFGYTFDTYNNLIKIQFNKFFNEPLNDSLYTFTSLQQLTFDYNFNNGKKPLENSLNTLTNLEQLTFGEFFNNGKELSDENYQPLENSLNTLTNLQQLTFGSYFNQPLNDSLKTLISLQQLTFGVHFNNGNKPLDNSLNTLTSLQKLTFGYYFYKPLNNSLNTITSLQELNIKNINYSHIGDTFSLPSLKKLSCGINLIKSLNNNPKILISLQELIILDNVFNEPLKGSMDRLVNLRRLTFGLNFNQNIEPLSKLTNLEELTCTTKLLYNNENYLKKANNLKHLIILDNEPIGNSLNPLTSLQKLTLDKDYNNPIPCYLIERSVNIILE
jgi:hypothetical protein